MIFDLDYSAETWEEVQDYLASTIKSIDEAAEKSGLCKTHIYRIIGHKSAYYMSTILLFNSLGYNVLFDAENKVIQISKVVEYE